MKQSYHNSSSLGLLEYTFISSQFPDLDRQRYTAKPTQVFDLAGPLLTPLMLLRFCVLVISIARCLL